MFYDTKKVTYALLLDIMKAFDSIDHKFLFAVLKKIRMPEWVTSAIEALMNSVKVTPVCGQGNGGWIKILKGVKQGCPLSPILFIIVYEVYLCKLNKRLSSPDSVTSAFADDVLLTSHCLKDFHFIHDEILAFERIGGCKTHPSKSLFVCNRGNDSLLNLTGRWSLSETGLLIWEFSSAGILLWTTSIVEL